MLSGPVSNRHDDQVFSTPSDTSSCRESTNDFSDIPMANILIIDDEEDIRLLMQRILEDRGHEVSHFRDGYYALAAVTEDSYQIAIVDLFMPIVDGLELIPKLAAAAPDMRIVAMSGGGNAGQATNLLKAAESFGAATTLMKPFSVADVQNLVDDLLS